MMRALLKFSSAAAVVVAVLGTDMALTAGTGSAAASTPMDSKAANAVVQAAPATTPGPTGSGADPAQDGVDGRNPTVEAEPGASPSGGTAGGIDTPSVPSAPTISQADASAEASLVAIEDRRLIEVRAVESIAPQHGNQWKQPYRLSTGTGYTLVLTARGAPYTVTDLLQLAPSTFLRQADGSFLLLEDIYVGRGAILQLAAPGGLKLKLASNPSGFVSIVSFGGDLRLLGSAQGGVEITSWDPRTARPDTDTTDGRAYLRSIGGAFTMTYTRVSDLGFWSGRTGGIGLTGTQRSASGSTTGPVPTTKRGGKPSKNKNPDPKDGPAKSDDSLSLGSTGVTAQPAGPLTDPVSQFEVPGLSYVTVRIDHSQIVGNAFGLFMSGATGIAVSDVQVTGSLITGVVLHRFATQAVLQNVVSNRNYGDGFLIARAAQEIQISSSRADYNLGNGFTVNGQPISQGPSAAGEPLGAYGNNTLARNSAKGNSHYGVEVLGGINIALDDNTLDGNQMGVVVRRGAENVTISGNVLRNQNREGISVRDGVKAVTVSSNTVQGAATGIYVRDSSAHVSGNTVSGASLHGVTMIGTNTGSVVENNIVGGEGASPIDTGRAHGTVSVGYNATGGWFDTTSTWTRVKALISPLTIVWICVISLLLFTSLKGYRARHRSAAKGGLGIDALGTHPYLKQRALPIPQMRSEKDSTGAEQAVAV